jgi:hypothetical protein
MSETRPLLEPIYDVTDGIASPASKIQYRFAFGRFLEYIQISQEGLLQKNCKELQALIIDYIRHLTAKRMKPGTIKLRVAVILHFFDMNDVLLNKRKITRFIKSITTLLKKRYGLSAAAVGTSYPLTFKRDIEGCCSGHIR